MSDDTRGVDHPAVAERGISRALRQRGVLRSSEPSGAEILQLARERGLSGPPDETQWAPASPKRSGPDYLDPKSSGQPSFSPSLALARGGTSLRQSISRMHITSEAYVRQMIDEYIRDTAGHPEVKRLHDEAVADRSALLAESEQREAQTEAAHRDRLIGHQKAADTAAALNVRLPYPLQALGAVATPAEKVAETALAAAGVVGMFIPYVNGALLALNALQTAVGYRIDPFPGIVQIAEDVAAGRHPGAGTLRHLGEKIEVDERVLNALFLAVLSAGVVVRAGSAGRKAIADYATRQRASGQDLASLTVRLASVEADIGTLREAVALARAGKPLSPGHLRAIAKTRQILGGAPGGTVTRGTANRETTGRVQEAPRQAPRPSRPPPQSPTSRPPQGTGVQQTRSAMLFSLRDQAVATAQKLVGQELQASGRASRLEARVGIYADAFFKAGVRQAVADGKLPSTIRVSPTVTINPASKSPTIKIPQVDIWDSATGEAWDVTTAKEVEVLRHEKYVGMTMPDGTVIRWIHFLLYHAIPE